MFVGLPIYLLNLQPYYMRAYKSSSSWLTSSEMIGFTLWLIGLTIESIADAQKDRHKRKGGTKPFLDTGMHE